MARFQDSCQLLKEAFFNKKPLDNGDLEKIKKSEENFENQWGRYLFTR